MKFSYRLQRVCGNVYSNGNVCFSPDGNTIISPVGNRLNIYDLVNQSTDTLPLENRKNIKLVVLSNNGRFLISVDVEGYALFFNFQRRVLMHKFHFKQRVYDLKFSSDDKYFAVTFNQGCQIWKTPNFKKHEFSPLSLNRTILGHHDETTSLDWSQDSSSLIIGSKDLTARVYYRVLLKCMSMSVLSGHRDEIIGVYFGKSRDEAYTIASDGAVFTWNYEKDLTSAGNKGDESTSDDESLDSNESEDSEDDNVEERMDKKNLKIAPKANNRKGGQWRLVDRQLLRDHQGEVSCSAFNRGSGILVLGFENGVFGLYEMPGCSNLHRLSVSNSALNAVAINPSGEWLAIGAAETGQLLVWEWKSESYIMKQQGHLYGLNALDFSAEGQFIATGGEDGRVKIWNAQSGFCVITFKEHIAPVTGVKFIGSGHGKALVSASLDGTIRAHDLLRYKNFRTLTSPTPVQFTSLACDSSGEVICAGSLDPFNIYVWSLQSGKLLEILAGHEGPIACLAFNSATSLLASGSWDGTLKLWDVYKNACVETFEHGCDVLAVAFRPDGKEVSCAATNGNIYFWDVDSGEQSAVIEGRADISGGRLTTDATTAENAARSKFFTSLDYSADGSCVLAGGRSKYLCIYSVVSGVLIKKFQLSHNRSLEGIMDKLRSDRVVDGVLLDNLDMNQEESGKSSGGYKKWSKALPGSGSSKMNDGSRTTRPELITSALQFSPTGREWAVASTQGLQVFGLDDALLFAPIDIDVSITPQAVYEMVANQEFSKAVVMALHLNELSVLKTAVESVEMSSIELVVKAINSQLLKELLKFLAAELSSSNKLEFYLRWALAILQAHGPYLQQSGRSNMSVTESLRALLRVLLQHEKEILRLSTDNLYMIEFVLSQMSEGRDRLSELESEAAALEAERGEAQGEDSDEFGVVYDSRERQGEREGEGGDGESIDEDNLNDLAMTGVWEDEDEDDPEESGEGAKGNEVEAGRGGSGNKSKRVPTRSRSRSHSRDFAEPSDVAEMIEKSSSFFSAPVSASSVNDFAMSELLSTSNANKTKRAKKK